VAGSHNLNATVIVRVQRVGAETRFAHIVALMDSAASTKPHSAQLADRLARPFLIGVLLAAGLSCVWWWGRDPGHALMVAVAVLVVTCPCALSLATPAAMLAAAGTLARSGVMVRNLQSLENLSRVDTLVFDKTGTLTRDAMVLGAIQSREGVSASQVLAMAAALGQHSLHPISKAIVIASEQKDFAGWACDGVAESAGQGVTGMLHRRSDTECSQPYPVRFGSAAYCGVESQLAERPRAYLSDDQGWLATFDLEEDIRDEAAITVRALESDHIDVHMVSGDAQASAALVAHMLGITRVKGGCSPADKLQLLRGLQLQGKTVAMVGDGLNDGPVLAGANVSFTFGRALPLAQARSDLVVMGDSLEDVVKSLRVARKTMRIVRQNLWWALVYNAACVPLAVLGFLPAWLAGLGMASSSLVVVVNALRLARNPPAIHAPQAL
jgi:Cu2+-exporting ATPase